LRPRTFLPPCPQSGHEDYAAPVARRTDVPDFVEAIARGVDVITAFAPHRPAMTLSEVAAAAGAA